MTAPRPPRPAADQPPPPTRLRVQQRQAGLRIDAFLFAALPFASRTRLRQKIQAGEALLNDRRAASSTRLREGDLVTVAWRGLPDAAPAPLMDILYEDDDLLAVDKPAGAACHPVGRIQAGTVIQFVRQREGRLVSARLEEGDTGWYPRLVNRLDVFTSGIVLVARTRQVLVAMQGLTEAGEVRKEYTALVEGEVAGEEGRINLPLRLDPLGRVRVKMHAHPGGRPCLTEWRVLGRMPGRTLLGVVISRGRQHQVRAHLAAIGHPVVGDLLYKDEELFLRWQEDRSDAALPRRHCLHAGRLTFPHPRSGAAVTIVSPLPRDFQEILSGIA
jgi:23S rRNA pseudouridine1911/1915/1917 synthase